MGMYGAERRQVLCEEGSSMTKQSQKDESDINNILRRFVKTGTLTHLAENPGTFADVSEIGDYRSALEQVRAAEATFMNLPAKVRTRFNNDPAEFLDFVTTPGHEDELKALGLWAEGKAAEPVKEAAKATGDRAVVVNADGEFVSE